MSRDNWKHRSEGMRCRSCMWYVPKDPAPPQPGANEPVAVKDLGRCRKRAPTLGGFPVVWASDWCGDHKLSEV